MNKTLKLSFLAAVSLQAAEPMVPESMSTERGGVKSAIDAYSDGGGAYLFDDKGRAAYDNSPMNNLVFKYGAEAKDSGTSLKDQVKTLSPSTEDEKLLAEKILTSIDSINPPLDGTICNDNLAYSYNDKYSDGMCIGTVANSCKDIKTIVAAAASGVYTIKPGNLSPITVYCDMLTDGGGWTLIGKGRQGWTFSDAGQGAITTVANSPSTADIATIPSTYVNAIINNQSLNTLSDGILLERLDGLNQRIKWQFTAASSFNWTFDTSPKSIKTYINGVYKSDGTTKDTDWTVYGNGCNRVFTWAWDGHNYVKGFSTGSTCDGKGWEYSTEAHSIPMTRVWVRN